MREHTRIPLIAKIEKPQAVARAEDIVRVADCIMVARGDLGIELPIQEVPMVQKRLLRLSGELARPSITATQMLDSMVRSARPTRAEVADVANAILDGTDAVMLSQETAIGAYPVEAVAMMDSVARITEREAPYRRWNETRVARDARDPSYTIAHSAVEAARELELDALIVPTLSGRSARLVSAHRPTVPIYRALAGQGDGAPLRPDVGRARGVDAPPRGDRGADRRRRAPRRRARLVPARASASASPPACRAAAPGARACSRSSASPTRASRAGGTADGALAGVARRPARASGRVATVARRARRPRHARAPGRGARAAAPTTPSTTSTAIAISVSGEPKFPNEPPSAT